MTFGEKLVYLRKKMKLTQQELAEKTNLKANTIANYEKGKTYPQNREVYSILAKALGVSVDELRNENDEFISAAGEKFGYGGKKQAMRLVEEMGGLFAGGELSDEDLDGVMKAFQDYYWKAKEDNKKYAPKKHNK